MDFKISRKKTIIFLLFTLLILTNLTVQAATEYIIGLTTQGIRSATVEEIELGFNYQLQSIGINKGYSMKIKVYANTEQIVKLITEKKIIGYFGSTKLLLDNVEKFNMNLLFTPVLSEKVMQRYVLLVRKDSGIDNISKLHKLSISYCAADEVGVLYLQKLLSDKKLGEIDTFFKKLVIKKNPNLDISAVFFKETQAALALEADFTVASELNPQLKQQLVIIEISPEYINNLIAISNDIDKPMSKSDIETHIMNLGNAVRSKTLMRSYNYGSMRKIKSDDLNSVRELVNSLKENKVKPQ